MSYENLFSVFRIHHHEQGLQKTRVGKFFLSPHGFEVLEDHDGYLSKLQGQPPASIARGIHRLHNSRMHEIVNHEDIRQGLHPELIQQSNDEGAEAPQSKFTYHRVGSQSPQTLTFTNGKAALDGYDLADNELKVLMQNAQEGKAHVRYHVPTEHGFSKTEEMAISLAKIEPHLEAALGAMRTAVKSGAMHPDHVKTMTKELFSDSMVPHMGNKKAYADFMTRPKQGVHIRMDGNDFGSINKLHGFEKGNEAIVSMGSSIRDAMDDAVGRKNGKLFRIGGDEFHAFVPNHEHAAQFARAVRARLEAIPAVGGTHNLSVSLGIGHTPDHAEAALINAKTAKKTANYPQGQSKTHAASMMPGFEGHIPLDDPKPAF